MADLLLLTGESVPSTARFRYVEISPGVYALATAAVLIRSDAPDGVQTDEITGALVTLSVVHHEVHEGEFFSVAYKAADGAPLADNGTIILAMRSATRYLHMQAFAACGGDAEVEFFTGSTIDADGTLMTPSNHKLSGGASTVTVRRDPTIGAAGTLRDNFLMPGGTGGNSIGGDGGQRDEWDISLNTWVFVRLTNRAGNAQPASVKVTWYEERDN